VASDFILLGIALIYGLTGTLDLAGISARINHTGYSRPVILALGLLVCGYGLKAALVPFHAWLPDAHPAAPAPVSATFTA
jgi:multicomponent Na+:H+ antiporter subunit D